MTRIHPTAVIDPSADLHEDVQIGPFVVIGKKVRIDSGTLIHSHCVLEHCHLGKNNEIFAHCIVGGRSQVLGDSGEGLLLMGDSNVVREATQIHRGSQKESGLTQMGNNNYIMSQCHIAHDCSLANNITMATYAGLAGHCQVDDFVVLGGSTNVSQFIRLGAYSFTAGRAKIRLDLPPFMIARDYSKLVGPNLVGLKRNSVARDDLRLIKEVFKRIYLKKENSNEVLNNLLQQSPGNQYLTIYKNFLAESKMGIMSRV